MKKKILLIISLLFFFSTNVVVKADDSSMSGSAGTHDQDDFTATFSKGMTYEQYGLRLTVINIEGEQISENVVDYWESGTPTGATMLDGSSFKTYIVNNKGLNYEVKPSATYNYKQGDPQNIKGASMSTWESKHQQLEDIIIDVEPGDKCVNPAFLDELGYDLCKALEDDCEALEKTYILVEPLMLTHLIENHSVKYVFSGTEYSFYLNNFKNEGKLVDHEGSMVPEGEHIIRNQIGGVMWTNLVNMRLSCFSDDDCTWGLKSGSSKYAYMPEKIDDNAFWNPLSAHAGYSRDANNNVYGTSMHLVWFGKLKDKCEEKCCIPCDPESDDFETCKEENHPNDTDYYCCYEEGEIWDENVIDKETGKPGVCIENDEYWSTREDFFKNYCAKCEIPPGGDPTYCCDDPEWKKDHPDEYEEYCNFGLCDIGNVFPGMELEQCDEENEENISHFRDGVFLGEFSDVNTYEDLISSKFVIGDKILPSMVDRIVFSSFEDDNTFQTIAANYASGREDRYTTYINEYCSMHCQEVFDVTLPDNYPRVEAGRYFYWSIKDSKNIITKASAAKLCAVDIDLDMAIDVYLDASEDARLAAENETRFRCEKNGNIGVSSDPRSGAYYQNCNQYEADYLAFQCTNKIDENGKYTSGYTLKTDSPTDGCDCRCVEPIMCPDNPETEADESQDVCGCNKCSDIYVPDDELSAADAIYDVYTGVDVYKWEKFACYAPQPIRDDKSSTRPSDCIGITQGFNGPPREWCNVTFDDYNNYISGYTETVGLIKSQILTCHKVGSAIVDMGVELEYQTLFENTDKSYSTSDEKIQKKSGVSSEYGTIVPACYYDSRDCQEDRDGNGYPDTYFYMDPETRILESEDLGCTIGVDNWGVEQKKYIDDPNTDCKLRYEPSFMEMLDVSSFEISGYLDGTFNCDDGTHVLGLAWNTIYASLITNEQLYKLDDSINACICKNGEVKHMVDGQCDCYEYVEHMDYDEFMSTYNNYQTLTDGTLSVEFMNGTGLYPISLKYWKIGTLDADGKGHFDSWLTELSGGACNNDEGEQVKCLYGDPFGVCRFVITNKIIATPDDTCEGDDCDPDPDICEGDDCDPEPIIPDLGDCIVNGEPVEECGNVAGLNLIYRVVDLDNPFPGIDGDGRTLPEYSNWYGKEYIITKNRGVSGNELYTSNITPLYSATLTPAVIKAIRADNEGLSPDYLAGTVIYPSDSPEVKGGGYSLFVHNFTFNGNQVIDSTIDNINSSTPKEQLDYDWNVQFDNILDTAATVGGDV